MFETLTTGIDGLDAILGGGIRYPSDTSAFVFITGGPGTGKTLLALEMVARAWLEGDDGSICLFYTVEQSPRTLAQKMQGDFDWYGHADRVDVRELEQEVPHRLCLEARRGRGRSRLVITQARPAALQDATAPGTSIDAEWILAEIGNYRLAGPVKMACIDNVGLLLSDLDYFGKRTALIETRRQLMGSRIHGIFVQEEADPASLRTPSAEEFSTDVLIRLDVAEEGSGGFKARSIEILKARHQYYYRGVHHYSIAGRAVQRDIYLGARNERGPGVHIYPSVAAQLSFSRDRARFHVPRRGDRVIDMGHPAFVNSFLSGSGPVARSSTVLLAEPGTRYTYLALRFLAAAADGEHTLLISTKEDRDSLQRICQREDALRDTVLADRSRFHPDFRVVFLHPEYISSGKFTWDIVRMAEGGHSHGTSEPVTRLAFDNIYRLTDRFPLIRDEWFLIPALLDLLTYRGVTSLFVDLVPPGAAKGRTEFDPARYMTTFDNVMHLFLDDDEARTPRLKVLKSTGNDFTQKAVAVDYRA